MSRPLWRFVLLALLVGSGCGSTATKAPRRSGGVVPWANRPLPLYSVPAPSQIRYPTSAPPCRHRQLRVSRGRSAAAMTNRLEELVFTNLGDSRCLLRGYPTISAETAAGRRLVLHPQRDGTYFGQLDPADLPPGGHVFLDLATGSSCELGRKPVVRYRQLVFALPEDGRVRGGKVSILEQCGLSMSEFGLPRRYAQPRPAPGTAATLEARLQLPARVRAGRTLRYIISLSNPTATPVVLRPCPGYTEGLYALGAAVRHSYALNCDSVRAVPAHGRVRYAMRLAVPRRAEPGIAKLGWNLDTPTGPFAAAIVQVSAR